MCLPELLFDKSQFGDYLTFSAKRFRHLTFSEKRFRHLTFSAKRFRHLTFSAKRFRQLTFSAKRFLMSMSISRHIGQDCTFIRQGLHVTWPFLEKKRFASFERSSPRFAFNVPVRQTRVASFKRSLARVVVTYLFQGKDCKISMFLC